MTEAVGPLVVEIEASDGRIGIDMNAPMPIGDLGALTVTRGSQPTLLWTPAGDSLSVEIAPLDRLLADRHPITKAQLQDVMAQSEIDELPPAPVILDLRVVLHGATLLVADRSSTEIWRADGHTEGRVEAHLDRLEPDSAGDYRFLEFRVSPNGRWIVAFFELGFAIWDKFELTTIEPYDEPLWRPVKVSNTGFRIDHYSGREREVVLA